MGEKEISGFYIVSC